MKKALFGLIALAVSAAAIAQQYKWVDNRGKVQYGDTPPPGVTATPLRSPSGPASASMPASAAKKDDAKVAKKGPLSPAEQEAEFRKRQIDARKEQEKQAQASQETVAKKENCARAQEYMRTLDSGQRISRTDASGERRFLEDADIAKEKTRARQDVQNWCN
jgi:hypothetical protein